MDYVVPPSLLFDFQLAVPKCSGPSSRKGGRLLDLPPAARLFFPAALNNVKIFADVKVGWNDDGFGVSLSVHGKTAAPIGNSTAIARADCLLLWIDTRAAGNVHRATEYCHSFACLPADEQTDGKPNVVSQPIAQQRNQRQEPNTSLFKCRTHSQKDGYEFEVWIPGTQLYGYREINELGRIGFYCVVNDAHLGEQTLIVGGDFPTGFDPSTWLQLELKS